MYADEAGELRRIAYALFDALCTLEPEPHLAVDLTRVDALTGSDAVHFVLHGKLCAQLLYRHGADPDSYDQDTVFTLATTLHLTVSRLVRAREDDTSSAVRVLEREQLRLRDLTMRLERRYAAELPDR